MLVLATTSAAAFAPHLLDHSRVAAPSHVARAAQVLCLVADERPLFGDPLSIHPSGRAAAGTSSEGHGLEDGSWEADPEDFALNAAVSVSLLAVTAALHASPVEAASTGAAAAAVVTDPQEILNKALKRAIGGGVSGALAGVAQVLLLMWLRTTMNYQYRNGGTTREALAALYEEGGLPRFYRGVQFALLQTPLTRFGDTASNTGVLALLATSDLPIGIRTACASTAAAIWRIGITPLDTMKTTLQVKGSEGYEQVRERVKADGIPVLWTGALGNALASFVGNYPWYLTFNTLDETLPKLDVTDDLKLKLCRAAVLGISAACVSDCVSNSVRVLKVTRQTSEVELSYREAAKQIIDKDGWTGLFGRGLQTRLFTNALQATIFTVVWKLAEEQLTKN